MGVTLSHRNGAPLLRLLRIGCYEMWCAHCNHAHRIEIGARCTGGAKVEFVNGDVFLPTFSPELEYLPDGCFFMLVDGIQHFSKSCTHAMAGKSAPVATFPTP